ncbi:MAG: hypothetical protein U0269_16215 [Polyangiales bacterium]
MSSNASLSTLFRSILCTVSALSLAACECGSSRVVIAISSSQIPPNASSSPNSRELNSTECSQLCRGFARECRIVEICTGVGASECVNRVPFTPEDASVDASVDGGPAPTRGFGVECVASHQCIGGRRPEGFEIEPCVESSVGAYLARQAALESASMPAFEQLAAQLAALAAPHELVERALDAVVDEFSHSVSIKALAAREGALAPPYAQRAAEQRSLVQLAMDNAVEGCVRETFAALVAVHQSMYADDEEIRRTFVAIAEDETRHAELSRDIHRWAIAQLERDDRARVEHARRAAIIALRDECAELSQSEEDRRRLGLPPPRVMLSMLDSLDRALWSQC